MKIKESRVSKKGKLKKYFRRWKKEDKKMKLERNEEEKEMNA